MAGGGRRFLGAGAVVLVCALALTAGAAALTYIGAITLDDPSHPNAVETDATASTCANEGAYPGTVADPEQYHYDQYTITSTSPTPSCVTARIASNSGEGVWLVAYLNSFDPADLARNFLADLGAGTRDAATMSFDVPGNGRFVLVVEEFVAGEGVASYTLTATGEGIPSAVRLRAFSARRGRQGVIVRWRTAAELNTLGFNVYRELGRVRTRLNARLIAASGTGARRGVYTVVDRRAPRLRGPLRYWLEAVGKDGSTTWHGPVRLS
jgi:hypothetical protein